MNDKAEEPGFGPFTVLLGIILGSLFAIAFCTCIVGFVFWYLGDEEPRLAAEVGKLVEIAVIFIGLTVLAGLGLLGSLWRP